MAEIVSIGKRRQEFVLLTTGQVPTIPVVANHTLPGWLATDLYDGEIAWNKADKLMWMRMDGEIMGPFALQSDIAGNGVIKKVKVSLSTAQLRTLGTVPVEAIPAPGAGKAILVHSFVVKLNFGTVGFSSNGICATVESIPAITTKVQALIPAVVGNTYNVIKSCIGYGSGNPENVKENEAILLVADSDDINSGDGTADVYMTYEEITL